jgi:regulator of RNase E activity RraA
VIASFQDASTSDVSDALGHVSAAMSALVRPLTPGGRVVGSALTVQTPGGDNLAVWKAIELAEPGDVLVISTEEHSESSTFGGLLVMAALKQGVRGIVTDGQCRDSAEIRASGLVAFAAGASPVAPAKRGPGAIGVAVRCAGVDVAPGDIVVGDDDGVVVIPHADAEATADRLAIVLEKEERVRRELSGGRVVPVWVVESADVVLIEPDD